MLDFACKQFKLDQIVKCGLGLTKADFKVLEFLMSEEDEWFTSDDLADNLKLNLSTIQRSVKKLNEKGIVTRIQKNLDGGGYIYQYRINDKKIIRKIIKDIIHKWVDRVDEALSKW